MSNSKSDALVWRHPFADDEQQPEFVEHWARAEDWSDWKVRSGGAGDVGTTPPSSVSP